MAPLDSLGWLAEPDAAGYAIGIAMLSAAGLAASFGCLLVLRRYAHRTDVLSKLFRRAARQRRGLGPMGAAASGTRDRALSGSMPMIEWELPAETSASPALELVT